VSPPTEEEGLSLGPSLVEDGMRLACQTLPLDNVEIEVVNLAPSSAWRTIPCENLDCPATSSHVGPRESHVPTRISRIALDVGTTNMCIALWDDAGSRRLAARRGPNPQSNFGADVVTRLQAARDPAVARYLAGAVELAVVEELRQVAESAGLALASCPTLLAVGNTAMLHLLQGSHGGLLDPEAWAGPVAWPSGRQLCWQLGPGHETAVNLVKPLGGFVGSDLIAAVLAAGLQEGKSPALLLDFGTNTEIALWDGKSLWVTSAAGGPAFEASGMACAVPADSGAIFRVRAGTPLGFEVLGGGAPKGVCGSGLVDWIACLCRAGVLSNRGKFLHGNDAGAPSLGGEGSGIFLSKRDVDVFQRGKAAIGAGVQLLARRAGIACRELGRIVTTGLFGRSLDVESAQAIGLLPPIAPECVEPYDNLALAGCEMMLGGGQGAAEALRERARLLNLAQCEDFEELFMQELFLAPMEVAT